jgi:hypothetical protein
LSCGARCFCNRWLRKSGFRAHERACSVICSWGTQNRKRHSLITRPRHLRASAIAISREDPHSQACDYSPHYGQWPLSSTVMLRDCQTGGENDRLGAGAYRGSRRRLRHSISAVGPKIPSTEAVKIARAGLFTSRQTSPHRISVQAIFVLLRATRWAISSMRASSALASASQGTPALCPSRCRCGHRPDCPESHPPLH